MQEQLTLFSEDSLAKTYLSPDGALDSTARVAVYGLKCSEPTTMDHMPIRSPEALLSMMESARKGRSMPSNLREQVDAETMTLWKTPQSRDFCTGPDKKDGQQSNLNDQTSGQLNPDWVEQMMGFPEGWTNPDVDEPQPWRGWPAPEAKASIAAWNEPF